METKVTNATTRPAHAMEAVVPDGRRRRRCQGERSYPRRAGRGRDPRFPFPILQLPRAVCGQRLGLASLINSKNEK